MIVATNEQCAQLNAPAARVQVSKVLDYIHTLSAASICFARGVNDTPKLTALFLAAQAFEARGAMLAVAAIMAMGGLLFSRRVARTMSQRMVRMDHAQGLSANLISAGLILLANKFGMPLGWRHSAAASTLDAQSLGSSGQHRVSASRQ